GRLPGESDPRLPAPLARLRGWIDQGAVIPATSAAPAAVDPPVQRHWAYVSPKRPDLPPVVNARWARNAIDRFVLARLEQEHLSPSPEAAKSALLRRVTLDLT